MAKQRFCFFGQELETFLAELSREAPDPAMQGRRRRWPVLSLLFRVGVVGKQSPAFKSEPVSMAA